VLGGTFAATLIKFPLAGVFIAMPVGFAAAFTSDRERPRDYIVQAIKMSKMARKKGLLSLEKSTSGTRFSARACAFASTAATWTTFARS
jgi:chemotaxis protein MotA